MLVNFIFLENNSLHQLLQLICLEPTNLFFLCVSFISVNLSFFGVSFSSIKLSNQFYSLCMRSSFFSQVLKISYRFSDF